MDADKSGLAAGGALECAEGRSVPDPNEDFAGWSDYRETQALRGLMSRGVPVRIGEAEYERTMHECWDEIDAMAEELGVQVPLPAGFDVDKDFSEVLETLTAFGVAAATIDPLELKNLPSGDVMAFVMERARSIQRGDLRTDTIAEAEAREREVLAALIERRSQGDMAYLTTAWKLRQCSFSRKTRALRTRILRVQMSASRRPRGRRIHRRGRPSRGDPSRADADSDPSPYRARGAAA